MSFELTSRQVKNLYKKIGLCTTKNEFKAVFMKYFPGVLDESSSETKADRSPKRSKIPIKKSGKSSGYRIISVSDDLKYPSSKYKNKETPMDAAESALSGILRKSGILKSDASFSFIIQNGSGPKYKYCISGGILKRKKKSNIISD